MCNGNITISETQSTLFASLRQGIKLAPDPLQCPSSIPASLLLLLLLAYLSNRSKCFIVTLPHTYTHTCTYKDIHICTYIYLLLRVCVLGIQSSVSFLLPLLSPQSQSSRMPINGWFWMKSGRGERIGKGGSKREEAEGKGKKRAAAG